MGPSDWHVRRYGARLAELTGRELGLPEDKINRLRVAMLICEVGADRIPPPAINRKTAQAARSLVDADGAGSRQAPISEPPEFDRALTNPAELNEVRAWICARHERPDGRGHPRGLTREQIPVEAKILSVVDAYVAITTDRPHSPAKHQAFALRELLDAAGSQFDARVVAAFVRARPRHHELIAA